MASPSGPFKANQMAQQIVRQFGAAAQEVRVPMRQCDDVARYIQKVENAHQQTANSTLRFGPPNPPSR